MSGTCQCLIVDHKAAWGFQSSLFYTKHLSLLFWEYMYNWFDYLPIGVLPLLCLYCSSGIPWYMHCLGEFLQNWYSDVKAWCDDVSFVYFEVRVSEARNFNVIQLQLMRTVCAAEYIILDNYSSSRLYMRHHLVQLVDAFWQVQDLLNFSNFFNGVSRCKAQGGQCADTTHGNSRCNLAARQVPSWTGWLWC